MKRLTIFLLLLLSFSFAFGQNKQFMRLTTGLNYKAGQNISFGYEYAETGKISIGFETNFNFNNSKIDEQAMIRLSALSSGYRVNQKKQSQLGGQFEVKYYFNQRFSSFFVGASAGFFHQTDKYNSTNPNPLFGCATFIPPDIVYPIFLSDIKSVQKSTHSIVQLKTGWQHNLGKHFSIGLLGSAGTQKEMMGSDVKTPIYQASILTGYRF